MRKTIHKNYDWGDSFTRTVSSFWGTAEPNDEEWFISETTTTLLPYTETYYCKAGLHPLPKKKVLTDRQCIQCRRASRLAYEKRHPFRKLGYQIRIKRDRIRVLEAELDTLLNRIVR